jgi:hypothetical protein
MEKGVKDVTTPGNPEMVVPDPRSREITEKARRGTASHKTAGNGGRVRENLGDGMW